MLFDSPVGLDNVLLLRWRSILAASVVAAILVVTGCGRSGPVIYPVSGKVTFQGKPVTTGMIRFSSPSTGIDIMARLQDGGIYCVNTAKGTGLPEGVYQVAIEPPQIDVPVGTMTMPQQPKWLDIPTKYQQPATSGLTLTVRPGDNTSAFNVALP